MISLGLKRNRACKISLRPTACYSDCLARRGQFLGFRLFECQGLFHPVGVLRVDALAPPVVVRLLAHQVLFLLPTLPLSFDRSSVNRNDTRKVEIGMITSLGSPVSRCLRLEENEVSVCGFPKSERMSCFLFDSAIDTDGDRSIILEHRKADLGDASVSFVAKRFDQL